MSFSRLDDSIKSEFAKFETRTFKKSSKKTSKAETRQLPTDIPPGDIPMTDAISGSVMVSRSAKFVTTQEGPLTGIEAIILQSVGNHYYSSGTSPRLDQITIAYSYPGTTIPTGYITTVLKMDTIPLRYVLNTPAYAATPGFEIKVSSSTADPFYVTIVPYSSDSCQMNSLGNYWTTFTAAKSCNVSLYRFSGVDGLPKMKRVYVRNTDGTPVSNVLVKVYTAGPTGLDAIQTDVPTTASGMIQLGLDASRSQRGAELKFESPQGLKTPLLFKFE